MLKEYIDLEYTPSKDEIVCEYSLEPAKGISFEQAATHMAGESSIDTWTDILTLSPALAKELKPHVFFLDKNKKMIKVAYSSDLFEINSVPQFLSSLAGNVFSMKLLDNLRLQDISFPEKVVKKFKGPKFGLHGVRKIINVKDRPLIGTIVKPKVGLISEKHAKVAYEAWVGGCDIVKDDENLTNQKFNPFEKRAMLTLKMRDKAEAETGKRKMYMCNITAPTCQEMLRRASFVRDLGGEYIMIDIIPVGWTALQTLREANEELNLVLHAHRCMHAAMTRNPKHGISMQVIADLVRLIGLDQLHVGTVIGKMYGEKAEVFALIEECEHKLIEENVSLHRLRQDWYHIKPVFPVASGGLHPGMIPYLIKMMGKDIIMQFGGGIHAHPMGTRAGAKAALDATDAAMKGIPLSEYESSELQAALKKWA